MHHVSKATVLALAAFALVNTALAQTPAGPVIGKPAPAIDLEVLLQAPDETKTDLESLKGNIVVIDFWATWCGPCVKAFPHLNELAAKFKDQPVRFIAITYEDKTKIESFLKSTKLDTWVGLDTDRSMHMQYQIRSIPRTFVIGRDGTLLADMHPLQLNEQMIEDVLAGKELTTASTLKVKAGVDPVLDPRLPAALYQVIIRPTLADGRGPTDMTDGAFTAIAMSLGEAVSIAYDVPTAHVVLEGDLPTNRYDVVLRMPPGHEDQLRTQFQLALVAAFNVEVTKQTREVECLNLQPIAGTEPDIEEHDGSDSAANLVSGDKKLEASNVTMATLANVLAGLFEKDVVDQTGLEGSYDFEITWQGRPSVEAVYQQLGLDLKPGTHESEVVVVRKAKVAGNP